jgi:hypothetical protein
MNLYLLKRDDYDYDEHDEALIRAESEQNARNIAEKELTAPKDAWTEEKATCEIVTVDGYLGVVIESFNAG